MTFKLVCANITVVMEEDRKKLTEKKLLSCGKREFLEKGYAKANLRSICEASGVTTGAFYFSFASKEALLRAILDPFIADSRELLSGLARMEEETGLSIAALSTLYILGEPQVAAAVVGTRSSRHVADTLTLAGRELSADARSELDQFVQKFPQIAGDCFDAEREPGGKHRNIMRMNLMDSVTGK